MQGSIAVIAGSDSFAAIWEEIAGSVDADVEITAPEDVDAGLRDALAVVVSVAGEETRAAGAVEDVGDFTGAPVAVVGAAADHRIAVQAIGAGAAEYFALPGDVEALRAWIRERAARRRAAARAESLARRQREDYDFGEMVGESPDLRRALDRAARIIPRADTTVLLTGETGTGKELLARAIHYNGPRAAEPFVEVNCTALPANLLEAELFGFEKGAFTGAASAKPGLFEAAHGGTIFLDEIGDLSLELQAKVLKAIEDREIRRLGSVKAHRVDARVIAATNVDLEEAVDEGSFREDLFYRLNVVPIHLPPLRERGDDVLVLAEHFLDAFSEEHDVPRPTLGDDVRGALLAHPWRGNVRELRNAIERAVLLGDEDVRPEELFGSRRGEKAEAGGELPFPATLEELEGAAVRRMIERCDGNKTAAAEALGISRSRLYRILDRREGDGGEDGA